MKIRDSRQGEKYIGYEFHPKDGLVTYVYSFSSTEAAREWSEGTVGGPDYTRGWVTNERWDEMLRECDRG